MNTLKLGWAGLGNMGTPMVKNLLRSAFQTMVYNRTPGKVHELTELGATVAGTPGALVAQNDVIITMVSDDKALLEIFTGSDGILAANAAGKICINMSTVSPALSAELASTCAEAGIRFLDAPVSGSVKPATDGTLLILASGDEDAFIKVQPVFEALGKKSFFLGAAGAGSSAKLAINYLLGLNIQGLAETVQFAQQNGVGLSDMLDIINESACGNGITKLKSANLLKDDYSPAFALKHMEKDLLLAYAAGVRTPLMPALKDTFGKAQQAGLGEEDAIAVKKVL